jgi:hypothetical protein
MTQRTFIALLTVVMFAAGYFVRVVSDRGEHVPPPPTALGVETAKNKQPIDRAKLIAEIDKNRRQIEAYRTQVEEIYSEFDREFAQLLTPAQREKWDADQKRRAEDEAKRKADVSPLTDDDITRARQQPLTDVYFMVTVTPRLDGFTKRYELDAAQQTSVRALLNLRRNKFIALLDGTPHPSIRLSRLAAMIERVGEPGKDAK